MTQRRIPIPIILLILFLVDGCYQLAIRHLSLLASLEWAAFDAFIYTAILWICVRLDLAKVTLCFLALPYLFFLPGWLNLPSAILFLVVFLYCSARTIYSTSAIHETKITGNDLLAFVCIAIFVNISGAGRYGFQWPDYQVHNARIRDLVEHPWPVRYGKDQNLVYYFAYYLPAAVLGKLTTLDIALRSMYVWTLLGATLVVRWLGFLSRWRFSFALALIFILFGPMDLLNVLISVFVTGGLEPAGWANGVEWQLRGPLRDVLSALPDNTDQLDFTLSFYLPDVYIGNYCSNTYSLYWSPQQVIAGWLGISLVTHLYREKKTRQLMFVYALLFLWVPLVMIAMFPFIILVLAPQFIKNPRDLFTIENTIGAGSLALLFIVFYLSGSASAVPSVWILSHFEWRTAWIILTLYATTWGVYALALTPFIGTQDKPTRYWFGCLIIVLVVLPLRTFGEWGDLLCRGSAPLMFLLLVFLLRASHQYWHNLRKTRAVLLLCLLILGLSSSIVTNYRSLRDYGQTQPVGSIIMYPEDYVYQNLGPDNTLFERLFRRALR